MSPDELLFAYAHLAEVIEAPDIEPTVIRDPADDRVLACGLAARAEMIVSGDKDSLILGAFKGIPIVDPAEALKRVTLRAGQNPRLVPCS